MPGGIKYQGFQQKREWQTTRSHATKLCVYVRSSELRSLTPRSRVYTLVIYLNLFYAEFRFMQRTDKKIM